MKRIICAGLGPGDPDLMSVRARRVVEGAGRVAFFRKAGRNGVARGIVDGLLRGDVEELAMDYPMTTEAPFNSPAYDQALSRFYDDWADRLADLDGETVVLCEGEPFLYGSFMHLYVRLRHRVDVDVIPGIPGMAGCWNVVGQPMTWGDDVLSVVPATLPSADLDRHAAGSEALVFMKTGRQLARVRSALTKAGRLEGAWLVEHGTMAQQRVIPLAKADDNTSYFSIVLVPGGGRRPGNAGRDC